MSQRLKDTKTLQNLKIAFAGEAQANRRYLYFAKKADEDNRPEIANAFRRIGDGLFRTGNSGDEPHTKH